MRVVSEDLDAEVSGTTTGDRLEVHAFRDGLVVAENLDVSVWSFNWDADRQVQGQASFTIADPDGMLAPWSLADPLGPGGSRLQVTYIFGASGTRVPLGQWRIRSVDPVEQWRTYDAGSEVLRVSGGGSVQVDADEETSTIQLARLDAETVKTATVLAEVRRLLEDICPVVVFAGVTDRAMPAGYIYDESRIDHVEDLLGLVNATHRMGADGSLEVVPLTGVGPVWTIAGGESGVMVTVSRSLSDDGVYNGVIARGESAAGQPLVGRSVILSGPLAWGGPFGRVPMFHQSVATSQAGVESDAESTLARHRASGEADLQVECLTHPGIQPNDVVVVLASTAVGEQALSGRVVSMRMGAATSDAGTTPSKRMNLTVRVPADALEAVARKVSHG